MTRVVTPPTETALRHRRKRGQHGKSVEERLAYAVSHRTRVYILTILNEGVYNPDEIAEMIGESRANVAHHIRELLDAGSIELAKTVPAGYGASQHYYRAVEQPFISHEEFASMSPEERQAIIGLTIQCYTAEVMSAFWAGKMESDPRFFLAWRWFNVDAQGKDELVDELERSWKRVQEIEAASSNRRAETAEAAQSIIIGMAGFRRERTASSPPVSSKDAQSK